MHHVRVSDDLDRLTVCGVEESRSGSRKGTSDEAAMGVIPKHRSFGSRASFLAACRGAGSSASLTSKHDSAYAGR
jgi:hypothetical protein